VTAHYRNDAYEVELPNGHRILSKKTNDTHSVRT
jgi:hypothetical protein